MLQTLSPTAPQTPRSIAEPLHREASSASVPPRLPRVAALIVTWNRKQAVEIVLRALAGQRYPRASLEVVVIDNGSSDGTIECLAERWHPDAIYDNATAAAHEPAFRRRAAAAHRNGHSHGAGFASLTLIANAHNHGGCGGFNTGLAFAEQILDRADLPLDYVWLVDDDVDLPESALEQLVRTAESRPEVGLVGSRTVDFADRKTTIETTIYFDHENGWMGPEPTPTHRLAESHRRWVEETGGTRGQLSFRGVREVDVVSACSLLARWSAVKKVGFWDHRYFIYCDDADWCLRFAKAGYKVVCDLDAVVYHTYWLSKLTPSRGYYSQRNLVWLIQKAFKGGQLRRATLRRLGALLVDSRKAMTHCRLFHAEIIRRTAHDIITNRGGKLDFQEPRFEPVVGALERAGALRADARIMVMCTHHESIAWADDLLHRLQHALIDANRQEDLPEWIYMVRQGVSGVAPAQGAVAGAYHPARIVFEPNRKSKWRAQKPFLRNPPDAVIIFEQCNDFPLLRSRRNIHLDRRHPGAAQVEPDGWRPRLAFLCRWAHTAVLSLVYAARVRPYTSPTKYG